MHLGISYAILAIALINALMWYRNSRKTPFLNLIFYAAATLGAISLWTIIAHQLDSPYALLSTYLPFVMVTGPFLLLIYRAVAEKTLSTQAIHPHAAGPASIIVVYLIAALAEEHAVAQLCFGIANTGLAVLLVAYMAAIGTRIGRSRTDRQKNIPFLFFILILMPLQLIAVIAMMVTASLSQQPGAFAVPQGLFAINDLLAFIASLLLFRCLLAKLSLSNEFTATEADYKRYQKSTLQECDMQQLAKKINEITENGLYLKPGLSLKDLARAAQAPAHHVTQTLSVYMQTDFFELINGKRTNQACQMLKETDKRTEIIWQECGFNSRATFNRHFRAVTGTTPMAFRLSHHATVEAAKMTAATNVSRQIIPALAD